MKIVPAILTKNPCYRTGETIPLKGLMLHSVGCPRPSAREFVEEWDTELYERACVHAFIDGFTGDVYQTLPWNHRGRHAGGAANLTHAGIEMCEPACLTYTSQFTFTCSDLAAAREMAGRTYAAAVELFADLCTEYGLDPLEDGVILSHTERHQRGAASNHADPEHFWTGLGLRYTMDGFRADVARAMA